MDRSGGEYRTQQLRLPLQVENGLGEAYTIADKMERYGRIDELVASAKAKLCSGDDAQWSEQDVWARSRS